MSSDAVPSTQSTTTQLEQSQIVAVQQTYPEELDKAWKALRDFVLDIIKEAEIEQKVAERLQKT